MAQNYILEDIRTLLIVEGYSDINIDFLLVPDTSTPSGQQILLVSEGGQSEPYVTGTEDFAIYVYRNNPKNAQEDSRAIWAYLNGLQGGLNTTNSVMINRITTRQKPMPYIQNNSKGIYCFMFTMTALINDNDILEYK